MTTLETKNLSKEYSSFLLDNINLKINGGEITALVGENGAGKSTTIGCISSIIKKTGGTILFKGKDISQLTPKERESLAFAYDDISFPLDFTIKDIEKYGSLLFSNWNKEKWDSLVKRLSLPEGKKLREFSKGMKAKTEIAYCLSHDPDLVILDETTASLDPVVRDELMDLFQEFVMDANKAILFSSHITSDLEKIADRIIFIHQGRLVLSVDHNELEEKWGVAHVEKTFPSLKEEGVTYERTRAYSKDLLISDRDSFKELHPNAVVDNATIESILLMIAKGEEE